MSFLSGWKSYLTGIVQIGAGVAVCILYPAAAPVGIGIALGGFQGIFQRNAISKLGIKSNDASGRPRI